MSEANSPDVTVLILPRERYSGIPKAIESLYANTNYPFNLIVIDGGLPPKYRDYLERESKQRNFTLIYRDEPLAPNQAKNIALGCVDTKYVVFADNDNEFMPDWLKPLVDTAEETGAWIVGPTIVDGDLETGIVHAAGVEANFREVNGKREYHIIASHWKTTYAEARQDLVRGPVEMLEMHVLLIRKDTFDKIGPMDEEILSFGDFHDLVLSVRKAGGLVFFEPDSVVTFPDPHTDVFRLEPVDLPYYWMRWSDEWAERSINRFADKWLEPDDPWIWQGKHWIRARRRDSYKVRGPLGRIVAFLSYRTPPKIGEFIDRMYAGPAISKLMNKWERGLQRQEAGSAEGKPAVSAPAS